MRKALCYDVAMMKNEMTTEKGKIKPQKGMRFLHSRWLDPSKMPEHVPALFQVTGFKYDNVYYAPVNQYFANGVMTREEVSKKREYVSVADFGKVCKQIIV